jgi:hypothetical protein
MILSSAAVLVMAMVSGCGGGSTASVPLAVLAAPGLTAPGLIASPYIGTFPLMEKNPEGTCGASVLPTQLQITGVADGLSKEGYPLTFLYGVIVGGAFDGTPFANVNSGIVEQDSIGAFVYSNHLFIINALLGTTNNPDEFKALQIYIPVWDTLKPLAGFTNLRTVTCYELSKDF